MSPPPSATDLSLTRITDVHIHIQPWRELKPPVLEVMWRGKEVERDRMIQIMDDPRALLEVMDRAGVWRAGLVNYPSPDVMGFTDATNAFAAKYAQADRERMKLVEVVTPARALGKEPIVVQDSPAFASSRLGRGFTAGGSACLPSADRGLPSLRSPPSRCAMGTSPVIVRPQPVRRRLPDAPSARDAELAEAIRRGDERALDRLLAHRWAPLVSYVAGRVGDVELAKDIAQEAFVRLWERRHKIDPSRSVVAYLYQVARRRAIDELRREDVRARWAEREHYQVLEATAADALVRPVPDHDVLAALDRAIAGLPGRRREAFTLVHVQELSYREAAEVMGIAPQTVANQVAAALAQLRCELKQLIADPTDVS